MVIKITFAFCTARVWNLLQSHYKNLCSRKNRAHLQKVCRSVTSAAESLFELTITIP